MGILTRRSAANYPAVCNSVTFSNNFINCNNCLLNESLIAHKFLSNARIRCKKRNHHFFKHYNNVQLHSTIGYVTLALKLTGKGKAILVETIYNNIK